MAAQGGSLGMIAVTGATGFVGRTLVEMLVGQGHQVRALVRSTSKAREVFATESLNSGAITLCKGALSDPDALNLLLKGATGCVHLVGIIREAKGQTFEGIHVNGTRAIVNACKNADESMRYVHMSALGVGPDARAGYRDTKHRAEQVVRGSGLEWTIVRPGLIHGPEGEFTQMAVRWARGKAPPFVFLPYFSRWKRGGVGFEAPFVAPVHVQDVARVFISALGHTQAIGRAYDLSGAQRLTFPEMLRIYGASITPRPMKRPAIGIPWRVAALQARIAGVLGLGGLLPFDEGMAIMGGRDAWCDNAPVEGELGVTPTGFEASLREYADQL